MPDKKSVEAALALINADPSMVLGLTVGAHKVTPGQEIPKGGKENSKECWIAKLTLNVEAQTAPELSFNVTSGTYMVIGLDIDAPFPSFNVLGPILHW